MSRDADDEGFPVAWLLTIIFALFWGLSSLGNSGSVDNRYNEAIVSIRAGDCVEAITALNHLLARYQAAEEDAKVQYGGNLAWANPLPPEMLGFTPEVLEQIKAKRKECAAFLWVTQTKDAQEMFGRAVGFTRVFPKSVLLPHLSKAIRHRTGFVKVEQLKSFAHEIE